MAPLPKRRHSRARQGKRRAAIKLASVSLAVCPNCGKMKLPHAICPSCGSYAGRVVVAPKVKTVVKKISPAESPAAEEPTSK